MMKITGIVTTYHRHPECIAKSLKADNLSSMTIEAGEEYVVWKIEGDKLRSVIASTDDYLMNLSVAEDICGCVSK